MHRSCLRFSFALTVPLAAAAACTESSAPPAGSSSAQEMTVAMTTTVAPVASFAAAMEPTAMMGGGDGILPGDVLEGPAKDSLGDDISTGLSDGPACVTLSWSGMTASITFDQCVIRYTGMTLDGTISATLFLSPFGLDVDYQDLTYGPLGLEGQISFHFGGEGSQGIFVDADLSYTGSTASVELEQLSIDGTPGGVTVDGGARVTTTGGAAAATAHGIHWNLGECLPSSGVLDLATTPAVAVTFLPTTPADGIVTVQVGSDPPANVAFFAPCPSE